MTDDFIVSYLIFCSDCTMFTEQFFTNHNLHPYQNIASRLKIVEIYSFIAKFKSFKVVCSRFICFYASLENFQNMA